MVRPLLALSWLVWCLLSMPTSVLWAQTPSGARQIFQEFLQEWKEDVWQPQDDSRRPGYMRPLDDRGWQYRMNSLHELAASHMKDVGEIRRVLKEGEAPERMLAAQSLAYTLNRECCDDLIEAAEHDADPAVRLYAIDSLSILTQQQHALLFRRLAQNETNRDVKRHLEYALERDDTSLSGRLAAELNHWDKRHLDTAKPGEQAPDFQLMSVTGEKISLSDYRGKKLVALVFVYGDT